MRKPLRISQKTIDRFWRKVALCSHGKTCETCCWEWQGNHQVRTNYGRFDLPAIGKKVRAHRVVWILEVLHHFPIQEGVFIMHNCDNPPCVNFHHLREGNHALNMVDKYTKGRIGTPGTAFTPQGAAKVRGAYLSGDYTIGQLADLFHVREHSISAILRQRTHAEVRDSLQIFVNQMLHMRRYYAYKAPKKLIH